MTWMTIIVVYSQQNSITMNPKEYKDVVYKIIGSAMKVPDKLTREQRHRCMASIRGRDTKSEMTVTKTMNVERGTK